MGAKITINLETAIVDNNTKFILSKFIKMLGGINFTLLFLLSFVYLFSAKLFSQSILFNHLTTNNGLSNNYVSSLIQDRLGFLWFATDDGLNRFDGYEFKVFRNNSSDKTSISDNSTFAITEDDSGRLWIGTKIGYINRYDPVLDKFTYWKIESEITKDNSITTIFIDKKFNVWIGTYRSGLFKLDPKTGKVINWSHKKEDQASISNNYISSIVEDNFGNLWIGTFNGLNQFNPEKSSTQFIRHFFDKNNLNSLSDNIVWAITQSLSDKNKLWIGTANGIISLNAQTIDFSRIIIPNPDNLQFGNGAGSVIEETIDGENILWINSYAGLLRYDVSRKRFDRFLSDKENPFSLISNQVNNILKDSSGVLWIATDNGLSFFSEKSINFNNSLLFSDYNFDLNKLDKLNAKVIAKTSDGTVWIGTDNGLYFSNNSNGKISFLKHSKLSSENIWSLTAGNSNDLWIGTYGSGLFNLNYKTNQLTKKYILDRVTNSSSKNFVKSVLKDYKNNLWIGYWGLGLARLNTITKEIDFWHHLTGKTNSLSHDDVWVIFQDSKSRIWIGTNGGGLNLYDESSGGTFTRFIVEEGNQNSLSSNSIYSIAESKIKIADSNTTTLWIGTNNGLNKFVINHSDSNSISNGKIKVTTHTIKDGLADNSIKSIVEDDNGNLWLGTSSGITFFDISKNTFTNFS
ncbi:MAG: two-component regulator propeller domain-containing protein, partial [Ignavibacteria bacterium]|nr:two-component regulator propeller domain-containing protein [Ignavibacteria bacterium]